MTRPEIDWYRALSVADWAISTSTEQVEHAFKMQLLLTDFLGHAINAKAVQNLAHAYLNLLRENGDLRIALDEARGVAVEENA